MSSGLAGVAVADTQMSLVDGQNGVLVYRGYNIFELGEKASFEEVAYLMWYGKLPNQQELDRLKAEFVSHRALPELITNILPQFPAEAHPMSVLRTCVSAFGMLDRGAENLDPANVLHQSKALVAVLPTMVAAWERVRKGLEPIAPRADLDHSANFLYMLNGQEPNPDAVKALDAYLVCLIDHGFNASTFAARVTFSTISDVYSAATAAIGTLKGNSHGRANQLAMEQFLEADASGDVEKWYHDKRAKGDRIMGIGHRIYKTIDPRGKILGPLAKRMAESSGDSRKWYDIATQIEGYTQQDPYFVERKLYANVDYYSAIVLYMVGLPTDQFTCIFAISRMVGWMAHVMEQLADNRLIRPGANYTGPMGYEFTPIENRD